MSLSESLRQRSASGYERPRNPSPAVSTPRAPDHMRAIVVESGLTGHVVAAFGSMLTLQDQRGRRFHGVAAVMLPLNAPVEFDISTDSEQGSRLRIATGIRQL